MSLYYVQKFLYELNRDPGLQSSYAAQRSEAGADPSGPHASVPSHVSSSSVMLPVLAPYELTDEEARALVEPDIGLLYVLGVNGQILMHFAALHQIEWADYLQRMRDGVAAHGPVRAGVYAITGYQGTEAHADSLGQATPSGHTGTET